MELCVVSHKLCWPAGHGFATNGGFPFQMEAISSLFDSTVLVVPIAREAAPREARRLSGRQLSVRAVDPIPGTDFRAKLSFLVWLPRNIGRVWKAIAESDAVHTPVPGDLGTLGILLALLSRKPLFVRHCGTWGHKETLTNRFLIWLLERIAGGRNVVLATGNSDAPPSDRNPAIGWIFSTTLSTKEIASIESARPWTKGQPLKLITVSRMSAGKNVDATIEALAMLRRSHADITLSVVGDGDHLDNLKHLAARLGVSEAVNFHGSVPHESVISLLCSSHLFVMPTRVAEGFPKAVLEAMVCGLPVVATSVSVVPELIGTECGIVLQVTDGPAVAKAIEQLVERGDFARMSEGARASSSGYTLEAWGRAIERKLVPAWGGLRDDDVAGSPASSRDELAEESRLKSAIRSAGSHLLWRSKIADVARSRLTAGGRFALTFHGVARERKDDLPWAVQPHLKMSELRTVLEWLKERFRLLTPEEFLMPGPGGVLLTFDDGFANNYTCVLPVLTEYEAPAAFFVTTQHVDDPSNWLPPVRAIARSHWGSEEEVPRDIAAEMFDGMSIEQLRICATSPWVTIGCHTHTHPFLTRCHNDQVSVELDRSRNLLQDWTGTSIDLFAYPAGDYDARIAAAVRDGGFRCAFTQDTRRVGMPRYEIPRIGIHYSDAPYLSLKMSGFHRPAIKSAPLDLPHINLRGRR